MRKLIVVALVVVAGCLPVPTQNNPAPANPEPVKAPEPQRKVYKDKDIWQVWQLYDNDIVAFENKYKNNWLDVSVQADGYGPGWGINKAGEDYYTIRQGYNAEQTIRVYLRPDAARKLSEMYQRSEKNHQAFAKGGGGTPFATPAAKQADVAGKKLDDEMKKLRLRVLVTDNNGIVFKDGHIVSSLDR